jgi:hypothetical protein
MPLSGRPRSLDPARCSEICALVAAGHRLAAVARLMGCSVKTIRRQARRDQQFASELKTAELAACNDPLRLVKRAAADNWRAAAWLLERTDPDRFARQPPATCRPEQVEDAFVRLTEAALVAINDEKLRRTVYHALREAGENETRRLLVPPRRRHTREPYAPLVAVEQTWDWIENIPRGYDLPAAGDPPHAHRTAQDFFAERDAADRAQAETAGKTSPKPQQNGPQAGLSAS